MALTQNRRSVILVFFLRKFVFVRIPQAIELGHQILHLRFARNVLSGEGWTSSSG